MVYLKPAANWLEAGEKTSKSPVDCNDYLQLFLVFSVGGGGGGRVYLFGKSTFVSQKNLTIKGLYARSQLPLRPMMTKSLHARSLLPPAPLFVERRG
jgi:hypothetical protein